MAQAITDDAYLLGLFKVWYTDEETQNLMYRNSSLMKEIRKERIGGKTYNFNMLYSRGGAVSGMYTYAIAQATTTARNAEMAVPPGRLFSVVLISQPEVMASKNAKGAYTPMAVEKLFVGSESFRKTMAACLYGSGWGELGQIPAALAVAQSATTMTLDYSTIIKMDIGTKFQCTSTADPSSALQSADAYTVTAINGKVVTFTPAVVPAGGFPVASWLTLYGGRDGSGYAQVPSGLGAWIPSFYNRGAAGGADLTAWNTYIGTAFNGVTRSVATERLAGNFYLRNSGASEKYIDAIVEATRIVRRAGGQPDLIVVNDEDYKQMITEIEANRTFFNPMSGAGSKGKLSASKGLSDFAYGFSTSFLDNVVDDPYCPKGTAYVLDKRVIKWLSISNAETPLNDGVSDNEPGRQNVSAANEPDLTYKLTIDDYINIVPATATDGGPSAQVTLAFYGGMAIINPADCCVVKF